jgi:hypothetical protein
VQKELFLDISPLEGDTTTLSQMSAVNHTVTRRHSQEEGYLSHVLILISMQQTFRQKL